MELDQAGQPALEEPARPAEAQGEKKRRSRRAAPLPGDLARGAAAGAGVAGALDHAAALLASVVRQAPSAPVTGLA